MDAAPAATPVTPSPPLSLPEGTATPATEVPKPADQAAAPKPELELTLEEAKALKAKASWEKKVRADKEAFERSQEEAKTKYERFDKFDQLYEQGDVLGAIRALKGDEFTDKLLRQVNEAIIREAEEQDDPVAARVRKTLDEERKAQELREQQARDSRRNDVKGRYLTAAHVALEAAADQYPDLVRALGLSRISGETIFDVAEGMAKRDGRAPSMEEVFKYCQDRINPPKAEEAKPEVKPTSTGAGISDLNASAAPTDEQIDRMSKDEYLAYVKRQYGLK